MLSFLLLSSCGFHRLGDSSDAAVGPDLENREMETLSDLSSMADVQAPVTWTPLHTAVTADLLAVHGSVNDIFAVGTNGTIINTQDHGAHWTVVDNPVGVAPLEGAFRIGVDYYAVGESATILHATS